DTGCQVSLVCWSCVIKNAWFHKEIISCRDCASIYKIQLRYSAMRLDYCVNDVKYIPHRVTTTRTSFFSRLLLLRYWSQDHPPIYFCSCGLCLSHGLSFLLFAGWLCANKTSDP
ncbi:unnamed protein product, partial [Callosobruchus maculatus]